MFAEVSCIEKLPLFWAIIPVYFVVVEVTLSMNYYIILDSRVSTFFRLVSLIFFEPLAFMTVLTHLISMFTSPGYVPDPFKPRYISNKLPQSNKNLERKERDDLYCKKCRNPRPPRAHHCKICRKCTLKMDHHCQWIANCVGYYNQKNFYQFLFYATTGDLVGCIFLFMRLPYCNFNIRENIPPGIKIKSPLSLMYYMWEPIQISIGALCGLAMTISIGTLFYKQTCMLLNNQTTIDKKMFENWNNSPYYQPNQMKNFCSVMGHSYSDWFSLKFNGNDPFYEKTDYYYNLDTYET